MKICILVLSMILLPKYSNATDLKCSKGYKSVTCGDVKNSSRTHLCLKNPQKLTSKKKVKWCKTSRD